VNWQLQTNTPSFQHDVHSTSVSHPGPAETALSPLSCGIDWLPHPTPTQAISTMPFFELGKSFDGRRLRGLGKFCRFSILQCWMLRLSRSPPLLSYRFLLSLRTPSTLFLVLLHFSLGPLNQCSNHSLHNIDVQARVQVAGTKAAITPSELAEFFIRYVSNDIDLS
jgi:hypothetical protein